MTYAPTINLVHKLQALITSPDICIWHFVGACGDVRPFHFWKVEKDAEGNPRAVEPSTSFDDFVEMVNAAYDVIDPLRIEPEAVKPPPGVVVNGPGAEFENGNGVILSARQVITRYEADTGPFIETGPTIYSLAGKEIPFEDFMALYGPVRNAQASGDAAAMADAVAAIDIAAARRAEGDV